MASDAVTMKFSGQRAKPGRPRRVLDTSRVRRLHNDGKTLDEIAALLHCGRGTVARALAAKPATYERHSGTRLPLHQRASELARSRNDGPPDAVEAKRRRENARHLVYQRWGDGMQVEGEPFKLAEPNRRGPGWAGIALMAGGLLLWAMGCPVPL